MKKQNVKSVLLSNLNRT